MRQVSYAVDDSGGLLRQYNNLQSDFDPDSQKGPSNETKRAKRLQKK